MPWLCSTQITPLFPTPPQHCWGSITDQPSSTCNGSPITITRPSPSPEEPSKGKTAQPGPALQPCCMAEVWPRAARRESKADRDPLEEGREEPTIGWAAPGFHLIRSTAAASKVYLGRVPLAGLSGTHGDGLSGRSETVVGFQRSAGSSPSRLVLATPPLHLPSSSGLL